MSFPSVAAKTYEGLKNHIEVRKLTKNLLNKLLRIKDPIKRARYIHQKVDESIEELFKDPAVSLHVQCKKECTACCHTQVSVTEDEAILLSQVILKDEKIKWDNFYRQAQVKNDGIKYFSIPYDQRRCIFLGDKDECRIYSDRPSVCRTNHAVSDPVLCETKNGVSKMMRLLNTVMGDLIIYIHFKFSKENGAMPYMIYKQLSGEKKLSYRRRIEL